MENVNKYMEMKLTTKKNITTKYFSKKTFQSARYIDGLYMVEFYKKEIVYHKANLCWDEHSGPLEANYNEVPLRRDT